ncbi:MAG: branched-chain amino acid ABC transporter permease [Candidatus Njordarchaeia archaeon]
MSFLLLMNALIDGFAFALIVYLIASGLVIIFGLMDILNFAQAAFFMLGAYLTIFQLLTLTNIYPLAIVITTGIGFVLGIIIEIVLLRPLYGNPSSQLLITLGVMLILIQIVTFIWPFGMVFPMKGFLYQGTVDVFGATVRFYKFVIILVGFITFIILHTILTKTYLGSILRAGIENRELAELFGINIKKVFTLAFGLGTAITFFGGAIVAPWLNATVELGTSFTLLAFTVIIVGGMKSHLGAFFASLIVGLLHQFSAYFFPQFTFIIDLLLMVVVLILRPQGLFGAEE